MATLRFTVAEADAGSRLDRTLAVRAEIGSRSLAERLVQAGLVLVDGVARPKSARLEAGSTIEVALPEGDEKLVPRPVRVPVLFEDEHLVVVDKPSGLTVHPGAGGRVDTLAAQLLTLGARGGGAERPGIVHRLDRDTSGLLVVARSERAYAELRSAIRRHE
ncbi:MAG TPA: RluA family pseudouridine synthase, partial [Gaiellaceae bacterium]|nr:RluA family pseudouridine synthase [Gaiellaceae bacterium]